MLRSAPPLRVRDSAISHRLTVCDRGRLLVVVFEGTIDRAEEGEALLAAAAIPGLKPEARILVDRRRARMTVGPEDVQPHMDLALRTFPKGQRPRMALVVGSDHDFGMVRMMELRGGDRLPHDLAVFRDLDEACAWLGVEASSVADALAPAT